MTFTDTMAPGNWKEIAKDIKNLSRCIGAFDGKHIANECPKQPGTVYVLQIGK